MLAPLVKSLDRFTMILNLYRISFSKLAIAKKRTGPINQAPPPQKKKRTTNDYNCFEHSAFWSY